jgi:hypothetical protein
VGEKGVKTGRGGRNPGAPELNRPSASPSRLPVGENWGKI